MRKIIPYASVAALALFLALLVGCSGAKASAGGTQAITVAATGFSPADVTVKVGTTVTWTNHDTTVHTVTSDNGDFDSGQMQPGGKYAYTFDKRGTYQYRCLVRPTMYAKITVIQ